MESERTPLIEGDKQPYQEPPPSYDAVIAGPPQPVAPTAPPLSAIEEQPYGLHAYQQPPQNAPRATTTTTTTTYTTVTTTEDTRYRQRYRNDYCPDILICYGCYFCYVPGPAPGGGCGDCDCNCLPPTTSCCEGNHNCKDCGNCGDNDNPIGLIIILILLALILVALIGIIAYLIYRMGDDKPPAVAKRYRIFAVVFGVVAYTIMISVGIAMAAVYA
ncbi:uncharacterized protein [Dysidea avara]|uniref:uncharacterized protein isoform X2 n=1 Tax=Dysidea avara TaxID=196820 RepID=UPI00332D46BA